MLTKINDLIGGKVHATDGDIGRVHDFFFDDITWTIRYMVVDTGNWLTGKNVLISCESLGTPDWDNKKFPVDLTREQVMKSPDLDTSQPVSRQYELRLHKHYGWAPYWTLGSMTGGAPLVVPVPEMESSETETAEAAEFNLRSVLEVTGYQVDSSGEDAGGISGLLVDTDGWALRYMVVKTGGWLSGRKVLVAVNWAEGISWPDRKVFLGLSKDKIKTSPPYDPKEEVTRKFEETFHDHYGQEGYWE
jgi:hypothetical protein